MGSCMGSCVRCTYSEDANKFFGPSLFYNQDRSPDFTNLIEENTVPAEQSKRYVLALLLSCCPGCRNFFLRFFMKRKDHKLPKKPVLELVEGIFNPPGDSYSRLNESQHLASSSSYNSRDIPLQCLDARALMTQTGASTPVSSLDLEWEHEGLPTSLTYEPSPNSWAILSEENCPTESSTQHAHGNNSEWSRVSSADSLEWDNVQNSFHNSSHNSEIDTDTQLLLSEIERLTSEVLKETGQNLIS